MFEQAEFGKVVFNRTLYTHDIYVHPSGKVEPRRKELSKLVHNTSHRVVAAEIEYLLQEDPDLIIIGTGYNGALHLTAQARDYLKDKGVLYHECTTPKAIQKYNSCCNCAILVHVTC